MPTLSSAEEKVRLGTAPVVVMNFGGSPWLFKVVKKGEKNKKQANANHYKIINPFPKRTFYRMSYIHAQLTHLSTRD